METPTPSRETLKALIKEVLAEMLGIETTTSQRLWYDTDPAYSHLGLDSAEHLRTMVRDGTLRIGHEVRDVRSPNSQIPRYQFHIQKCEARLTVAPEKRSNVLRAERSRTLKYKKIS